VRRLPWTREKPTLSSGLLTTDTGLNGHCITE
jgi:hypothetical protein